MGLSAWRIGVSWARGACASFGTASFAVGAQFVQAISGMPGIGNEYPDVDVRQESVIVRLITVSR